MPSDESVFLTEIGIREEGTAMPERPLEPSESAPLEDLDDWEESLRERYPQPGAKSAFRDYGATVRPSVREFYRLNHTHQTVAFVKEKKQEFLSRDRRRMGIWEAMEFLNELVDDSDPDTQLSQIEHLMQTAEAIRADGHPRWFILTGLIHDLGKILCLWGEPQWAVVGDTFPVGCRYSEKIVFHEFFEHNPDWNIPEYQTENGIYEPNCGLDGVDLSWGHDEYLYHVAKDYLPEEGLAMIRYHSFYPAHREGEYAHLMNGRDHYQMEWVRKFNPYDLYSKGHEPPDVARLMPYYQELIAEFFPETIAW
jgi:inositol oxygenase